MGLKFLLAKLISKLQIPVIRNSEIDKTAVIYEKCEVYDSRIGKHSYIAPQTKVLCAEIGSFCSVGSGNNIGLSLHPLSMVSTSPCFLQGKSAARVQWAEHEYEDKKPLKIGNDVWIGNNCCIMGGVSIGDGAVIGAQSVVTHDVGAYEIWAGNPARLIRRRLDEESAARLSELCWWDWPDEKIQSYAPYFDSPERLLSAVEKNSRN